MYIYAPTLATIPVALRMLHPLATTFIALLRSRVARIITPPPRTPAREPIITPDAIEEVIPTNGSVWCAISAFSLASSASIRARCFGVSVISRIARASGPGSLAEPLPCREMPKGKILRRQLQTYFTVGCLPCKPAAHGSRVECI